MGEAELARRSASQIELTSILAHARWRAQAVWVQLLNNIYVYIYFAYATRAVWSACHRDINTPRALKDGLPMQSVLIMQTYFLGS